MPPLTQTKNDFTCLGLSDGLLKTLGRSGFITPTPIQAEAIPPAMQGRDVVGIAQTGTGKTLAFGLPMIERLQNSNKVGLVLAPTRELALQIEETFHKVGAPHGIKTAVLIGGAPMGRQISHLRARPHVIIATPGRLLDHMSQRTVDLRNVGILVLDEADRMLDMGFAPAIERIVATVPRERQTLFFSATMPVEITSMADRYLKQPVRVEVARQGTAAELVSQEILVVPKEAKNDLLEKVLAEHGGTILVFARTRHGARKVARSVRIMGHSAAELHSDRTLAQRRAALDGFKSGAYRVLVATDIAARGIDVKSISLVVNYDLPDQAEDYVHRIGRTGRAGETGHAISFATPDQAKDIRDIERLIRTRIPVTSGNLIPLPAQGGQRPASRTRPHHPVPGPRPSGHSSDFRPPRRHTRR
jgi:ATP-dependent RNA helicase RhlE